MTALGILGFTAIWGMGIGMAVVASLILGIGMGLLFVI